MLSENYLHGKTKKNPSIRLKLDRIEQQYISIYLFIYSNLILYYWFYWIHCFVLFQARRQLQAGGWVSDQESLGSLPRTQGGALTPGGSAPSTGLPLAPGDRGSCSADSGVRGNWKNSRKANL